MGGPELPGDPGEENLRPTQLVQHPPLPSDDNSDNEAMEVNAYQLLPMGDEMDIEADIDNHLMDDDDNDEQENEDALKIAPGTFAEADDLSVEQVTHGDPNIPNIESVDVEIERQVWSEPRPQELQLELDNTRTEQILNAMANFTLPNLAVPDWAEGVPEERWKEELLQRIRQRKEPRTKVDCDRISDTQKQND